MPKNKGKQKINETVKFTSDMNLDHVVISDFDTLKQTFKLARNDNRVSFSNTNQRKKTHILDDNSRNRNNSILSHNLSDSQIKYLFIQAIFKEMNITIENCKNINAKRALTEANYQFKKIFDLNNFKSEAIVELLNQISIAIHKIQTTKENLESIKYLQNQWNKIFQLVEGYEYRISKSNVNTSICKSDKENDKYNIRLPESSIKNFDFYLLNTLYMAAFFSHLYTLHVHKEGHHLNSSVTGESINESFELVENIKEVFWNIFKKPLQELGSEEIKRQLASHDTADKLLTKINPKDIYSCHLSNVNNIELLNPFYQPTNDRHCVFTLTGITKTYNDIFNEGVDIAKVKNFDIGHDQDWLSQYSKTKFTNVIKNEIFSPNNKFNFTKFENFIKNLIDELNKAPEKRKAIKFFQSKNIHSIHEFKSALMKLLESSKVQEDIDLAFSMAKELDKYMDASIIVDRYVDLTRNLLVNQTMHCIDKCIAELYEHSSERTLLQLEQFLDKPVKELVSRELPSPPAKELPVKKA